MQRGSQTVTIRMDTYKDYNEAVASRSHTYSVTAEGGILWDLLGSVGDGFDWGDGSLWGASSAEGSAIVRAAPSGAGQGGLGVASAIQLHFMTNSGSEGIAWGVNAVVLKYVLRRFTT
jgi:hypothetical protein